MNNHYSNRDYWVNTLLKIASPVYRHLAEGRLRECMPIDAPEGWRERRAFCTHLEALGRSLAGIAPWLEADGLVGEEEEKREQLQGLVLRSLRHATDPESPDFMDFCSEYQPLVDSAFMALGLLRSYNKIWMKLDSNIQSNVIRCLKQTRKQIPVFSNWLMFSATIEAFFCRVGEDWDKMRVDYAIRQHEQWYKGDGVYGDGPRFRWDYYNSYVIQPMLLEVLEAVARESREWDAFRERMLRRAQRYAVILERLVSPEGTYPILGRSSAYRTGAFQTLAQLALKKQLPPELPPAQARCAMTAVMQRMYEAPGTFDEKGWLRLGFCGYQPSVAEGYVSTGSLYLCLCSFLPLGLPPEDEFWGGDARDWTQKRAWAGEDLPADHGMEE